MPGRVENLKWTIDEEKETAVCTWNKLEIRPNKYLVQWRVDDEAITEEFTSIPEFSVNWIKPGHRYQLRVMASNNSGNGEMSGWQTYISRKFVGSFENRFSCLFHLLQNTLNTH